MKQKNSEQQNKQTAQTAVALTYDGFNTPRVTASGKNLTAERILEIAKQNDVPIQHNAGLAMALSEIPLDTEIPAELYFVVAEVLAFVYFLDEVEQDTYPDDGTIDYSDNVNC